MINKFNKKLSLITAGTLFISNTYIISAYADSNRINFSTQSSVESNNITLNYEDGCINNAVAFAENKFYINGNITSDNSENNYYLSDNHLTSLTNFLGYDITLYDKNYLSAENGNYYINLETGEITEDDLQENNLIDATINLRKKIRKFADDRYSDFFEAKSLDELINYKFNDTWYETKYHSNNPTNGYDYDAPLTVYTDIQGNYIDADYNLGSIEVITTNKTVSITNTNEVTEEISISVSNQQTIGHDASNIYRIATLTITSDEEIKKINGLDIQNIKDSAFRIYDNGQIVSFDVIQQISKEQSDDSIDGAKYSSTVSTYILSNDTGTSIPLSANLKYSISDEEIIAYSINNNKIETSTITLQTSTNYNFIEIETLAAESFDAYDIDSSGELWILKSGFIYKYATDEWEKNYKVDGLMNNLSIYDSNNFVVWNTDDERYLIYANKTTNTENSEENITELSKSQYEWIQNQDGTWSYLLEDSTKKAGWLLYNSKWYHLDSNGNMNTGWLNNNEKWYYLNSDGSMRTGWLNDNGKWYYLNSDGSMRTGWLNDNGKWYYLDINGAMLSNTTVDGYILNSSGEWIS